MSQADEYYTGHAPQRKTMRDSRVEWDIVERLRERSQLINAEAADTIETLRAEVSRLTGEIEGISRSDLIERLHDIDQSDGLTYQAAADLFFELCPGLKGKAD